MGQSDNQSVLKEEEEQVVANEFFGEYFTDYFFAKNTKAYVINNLFLLTLNKNQLIFHSLSSRCLQHHWQPLEEKPRDPSFLYLAVVCGCYDEDIEQRTSRRLGSSRWSVNVKGKHSLEYSQIAAVPQPSSRIH